MGTRAELTRMPFAWADTFQKSDLVTLTSRLLCKYEHQEHPGSFLQGSIWSWVSGWATPTTVATC